VSLVLPVAGPIARAVLGEGGTVAIRVPAHPIARGLAAAVGRVLSATSANASGHPPARRQSEHGDLLVDPRVSAIDAGETPGGRASTIVDARSVPPRLIRDGAVPWSRVLESLEG
jgi:L-threonylcarbamoyladenylate synthase